MAFHRRSEDDGNEATEPLYRDSNEHVEKPSQHDFNDQTEALHASLKRLRGWLIAVGVLLAIACAYILFSFRHVVRDHTALKRQSFAPESKVIRISTYHATTYITPQCQSNP